MPSESSKRPVTGAEWLAAIRGQDPAPVAGNAGSSPASDTPKARPASQPKAPAPPTRESPSDQLDETVEGHAIVLARSQSTLGEIIASVAESFALPLAEAAKRVEAIKLTLLVAAHSGRAFLRRRIFDAATGRAIISRDERNLLMALGRQHLGHTTAGTDSKVRRIVEAAERRALGVGMTDEQPEPDDSPRIDGEDSI